MIHPASSEREFTVNLNPVLMNIFWNEKKIRHYWLVFFSIICAVCLLFKQLSYFYEKLKLKSPWPESASELYRLSDRRLSAKLVPTFADIGCHVASVTDPCGRNLGFLNRSRYFFFQVAPHLYSRGWVDPVPDPLLLRKSGSAKNRTRTPGSLATRPQRRSVIYLWQPFYPALSTQICSCRL
jgi:hypothetical protein